MKKTLFTTLLFYSLSASAWDNPSANFDASKNTSESLTITWKVVDNVQKVCEEESKRRGYKGFGYTVNACSFWIGNQCTIITKQQTSMHTLGHEIRHCFQGNWH
jgi:hypothetical protein